MAYLKPALFTRKVFNGLAMRFGISGAATLAVPGRTTGAIQTIPVIPVEHEGARYLVSTRGESEWVRNLRAAGAAELRRKDGTERFRAVELSVDERPLIITAYRDVAGKAVAGYFDKLPDPGDHPVFLVEPSASE